MSCLGPAEKRIQRDVDAEGFPRGSIQQPAEETILLGLYR